MDLLIEFSLNLLRALPVIGVLLLVSAANTKRNVRVRQSALPVVVSVYSVVVLVILYRFNDVVTGIIRLVSDLIPFLRFSTGSAALYIAENTTVISTFLLIKIALKPLFHFLFSENREISRRLVSNVYEFVPEFNSWFVSKQFGNLRAYWRVFYWTSIVLTLLIVTAALTFSDWLGFSAIAFPAIATLIIGEVYFAIDGLTQDEFRNDIQGEADSSRKVANYGPLREVLRDTFPDRVLADGIHLASTASTNSSLQVGQLARDEDDIARMAGTFFNNMSDLGKSVDINMVESSVGLMRGTSMMINNPFYSDLTPYLCLPVYYKLLQSKKCLVIVGRDSLAGDLVKWVTEGLESITGIPNLWNVEILRDQGRDALHVGILRFGDIHNLELLRANDEFFCDVEYVILAEPSRMLSTGQLGLSIVASRCSRNNSPTYVAFDGNHDGLVDALSHLFKVSLTEVVASAMPQGFSAEVVWRAEGPHMHSNILPEVSRYLGMGPEIGAVAWKYHVSHVHWVGADVFPVTDMSWIVQQYYPAINAFAGLELSQEVLGSSLLATPNPWGIKKAGNYFLIVEDEISNVYETIRRFATRATSSGFINLISENYLLRDYMVDNRHLFSSDPKAIPSITPDFARTERNVVLRVIMTLVAFELSENQIAAELGLSNWSATSEDSTESAESSIQDAPFIQELRRTIEKYTGASDVSIRSTTKIEYGDQQFESRVNYYHIDQGSSLDSVISALKPAYFYVEDEQADTNIIGSLLFDHVFQTLLPGQFVTYGGKYYEVQGIGSADERGGVILRRAAEHIRDRWIYRNIRDYTVVDFVSADVMGSTVNFGGVELRRFTASIDIQSLGYLELPDRSNVAKARKVLINSIPNRRYTNKAILEVRFPDVSPDVRKTITLLLNELFVTVFPYAHEYVAALTPDAEMEFGMLLNSINVEGAGDSIFIIEDSMIDLGLLITVERNWQRFLEIITDYLEWDASPVPTKKESRTKDFVLEFPVLPERPRKLGLFERLIKRIKGLLTRKDKEPAETPKAAESEEAEVQVQVQDNTPEVVNESK